MFRLFSFRFAREFLPYRAFLSLPLSALRRSRGHEHVLRLQSCALGGIFTFDHAATQVFNLLLRIDWFGWRNKRSRLEIGLLAVCAMKPDAKLAGKF